MVTRKWLPAAAGAGIAILLLIALSVLPAARHPVRVVGLVLIVVGILAAVCILLLRAVRSRRSE